MIYCINPDCSHRQNPEDIESCQNCGTPLLVREKYWLLHPLRPLDPERSTEIFEVEVEGERRVMKILKSSNPKLVELFDQEAFTLEVLDHPGIPKIDLDGYFKLDLKTGKTLHCIVMEKIEGQNLEQWLEANRKISQKIALNWLRQIIEILDYIHIQKFFHRDIKPSNIILKSNGQLVLIDFGTAREITDTYLIKSRSGNQPNITTIVSGGYTPPEQISGHALPQSDFFALGRTFVHLLTGKTPMELPTDDRTGKLIWQKQAPQISKPLADFIDELMAAIPGDRPQNSATALRYLTGRGLRIRSIERFVESSRFKLAISWLISIGVILLVVNRFIISPLRAELVYSPQGREALNADDFEKARQNLERAVKLDPNDPVHRNDLGLACSLLKDFDCALVQYKESLKLRRSSRDSIVRYNLGLLYEDIREFDLAIEQYKAIIYSESHPEDKDVKIDAMNTYARLQIWQKHNYESAIKLCERALAQKPNSKSRSRSYKNLGWAYFQQNRYQDAKQSLLESIRLDQVQVDKDRRAAPYCLLSKVFQAEGDKHNSLSYWKKCRDLNSGDLPEVETWQSEAIQQINAIQGEF